MRVARKENTAKINKIKNNRLQILKSVLLDLFDPLVSPKKKNMEFLFIQVQKYFIPRNRSQNCHWKGGSLLEIYCRYMVGTKNASSLSLGSFHKYAYPFPLPQ